MQERRQLAIVGGALLAVLATPAAADDSARRLTSEVARERVTLHEDPLEVEATLSTRKVMRSTRGVLRTPYNDNHLQAHIDRRTGRTRFEVHQTLQYLGSYRGFDQVHYETGAWPTAAKVRKIDGNQPACDAIDPQSACYEEVSFVVGEAELRRLTSSAQAATWSFKFKPERGGEQRASLPRAEIAGLLQAVDAYRVRAKAAPAVALAEPAGAPGAP